MRRSKNRGAYVGTWVLLIGLIWIDASACRRARRFEAIESGSSRTCYLIDLEHRQDSETLLATSSHLVVFNGGDRAADLDVTAYYEDLEPDHFTLRARALASTESNSFGWPIHKGRRFALKIASSAPVVCQATIGWMNTNGDYGRGAPTRSAAGPRETAKSYTAITSLARDWQYADGIVISGAPQSIWIHESEWAILLNPGNAPARIVMRLHKNGSVEDHPVDVPARRISHVFMDDIVEHNQHYGVSLTSDQDVAFQWVRTMNWYDSPELMSSWSVPGVPVVQVLEGASR